MAKCDSQVSYMPDLNMIQINTLQINIWDNHRTKYIRRTSIGFTLVELLVVIAIVGLLVMLLLPAVNAAREAARMTSCKNNIRQAGLALLTHENSHRTLPSGWTADEPAGDPGWGWATKILPFIEETTVYESFDLKTSISSVTNNLNRDTFLPIYSCPSDSTPTVVTFDVLRGQNVSVARANFVGAFGSNEIEEEPSNGNGVLFHNSNMPLKKIHDGLSKTFLVGERASRLGPSIWIGSIAGVAESMARIVGSTDHPPNSVSGHFDDFSSHHPTGAHFVMCDGSTRLFTDDVDEIAYKSLATRSGSETLNQNE